jgi:hemerythrin-like domain-containing protein
VIKLDDLTKTGPKTEAGHSTLDRPLDHLLACHRRIEAKLEVLERAGAALESQPTEARDAIQSVLKFFESNGVLHTQDEEQSVFPRLLAHLSPEERAYIEAPEHTHRDADALHEELDEMVKSGTIPPEQFRHLVTRLKEIYREHIASEDRDLIALGARILSEDELAAIAKEMKIRRGL